MQDTQDAVPLSAPFLSADQDVPHTYSHSGSDYLKICNFFFFHLND